MHVLAEFPRIRMHDISSVPLTNKTTACGSRCRPPRSTEMARSWRRSLGVSIGVIVYVSLGLRVGVIYVTRRKRDLAPLKLRKKSL